MPKMRPATDILYDAMKQLVLFRGRMLKEYENHEVASTLTQIISTLEGIATSIPKENDSFTNKQLNNALNLIVKEQKKTTPKIDLLAAIRHIYSCNSTQDAMRIGLKYGFTQEQIKRVMIRAPIDTNLGKIMERLKAKPIPTTPNVVSADDTINSDISTDMPDDLMQQLGVQR